MNLKILVIFLIFASLKVYASEPYFMELERDGRAFSICLHRPTLSDFESLADQTKYIKASSLLYNRDSHNQIDSFSKCVDRIDELAKFASIELLKQTLAHESPRVRTLGLYAMHAKEDPKLLPLIYDALQDKEQSFPRELPFSSVRIDGNYGITVKDSTVADNAADIISFYMEHATYAFDNDGKLNPRFEKEWQEYWKPRKDRDHCASWIGAKLKRATGGISELPGERLRKVENIKYNVIRKLPPPDRQLTLLRFGAEWRSHPDDRVLQEHRDIRTLASEFDLREACQQLGHDRLMKILSHTPITNDPDLQPYNREYRQIVRWILIIANDVLPPEAAPKLIELGLTQNDRDIHNREDISPWWFIAAAELQPHKATEYIELGWPLFRERYQDNERGYLMWAQWKISRLRAYEKLSKRFYSEEFETYTIGGGNHRFLRLLRGSDAPVFIAKLALEDSFLQLNAQDLGHFALAVSRFAFNPPVDPQDYTDIGRPGRPSLVNAQEAIRAWAKNILSLKETQQDASLTRTSRASELVRQRK